MKRPLILLCGLALAFVAWWVMTRSARINVARARAVAERHR